LNEAIPPAYTRFIGRQLLAYIQAEAGASHFCRPKVTIPRPCNPTENVLAPFAAR
jgi:hypothetical protein